MLDFKKLILLPFGLILLGLGGGSVQGQTNTSRPVFLGTTNLAGRVGQDFRYQILIGGTGRQWVGSDSFTSAAISSVWTPLTNTNGRLTNANSQLNLVASNASGSNAAVGVLQWAQALPSTNSWLAYLQVVVTNDLPVTNSQSAAAGISLFQSNRPSGSLVFTNTSDAALIREGSVTNRVESVFRLNNSPFTGTFASNTATFYQRQAGPTNAPSTAAALVFSNLGTSNSPTNTLFYRSTTNSTLVDSNGLILGTPGPATAVASPSILLPSSTNWTVTVRVHYDSANFLPTTYVGPAIVKNNPNGTPMQMFTNRVTLALAQDDFGLYVASEAFAGGTNIYSDDGAPWAWVEDEAWLRFSYNASTALLSCAFFDPSVNDWIDTQDSFDLSGDPGSLGADWNFSAGSDFFRLLLVADTSAPGGNTNGADPVYFTDLVVETEPADRSTASDGSTVWIGLLYDATTTNLVQQFSGPDGGFTDLASVTNTQVNLGPWGTNSVSPLLLRIGAEAGQTNLPLGGVALRNFAVIPAPGDMGYSSTNLPGGLSLDTNYGVISGIPTNAGTNIFTVVASNPYGGLTATQSFLINVSPTLPVLAVSSNGILKFGVTNTNAILVRATNYPSFGTNPLVFTASGLPTGLVLSNQAGGTSAVVRGAPLAGVGTNPVVFTASNSIAGAVTITSVVTVEPGSPVLRLVQNRAVPRYSTSAVVSTTQPFWTLTNIATGQNGGVFTNLFTANSNFPSNALRLNSSNGQILALTNRITNAGNFTNVVFTLSNAGGTAILTSTITILPATNIILALATNPPFPSNGIAFGASNTNFFQLLVDTNAPGQGAGFTNTFALQSAPSGIRINPTNGIVFGTNNQAGNFTLQISARNLGGFAVTNITLGSKPPAPLFRVTTNRAQFGSNSTNALVMTLTNPSQLNTNAYPVTWSASNLPPGFTNALVGTNFVIRSTNPAEAGLFSNITVIATNAGGATTNSNITLEVLPAIPAVSVASNGTYQYEVENTNGIVVTVTNTNGQNTNLFPISFSATNLPGGWALSTNGGGLAGVIGSTGPTVATNVTNLLVTITNKGGLRTTNLTLRVLPEVPTISLVTNTNNRLQFGTNSPNAVNVVVGSAGQNTNNFPIGFLASNLPTGVQFTTNTTNRFIGVIGGSNPAQAGVFTNVVLTITNAAGTNTETITLTVLPAAPQFSVTTNRAQFGSNSTNPVVVTVTNTSGQNLTNFPLSFSSSNLPGGITFTNTNSFVATAGAASPSLATNNASFTIVVTNAGGSATSNVTSFRILPALPALLAATNGDFQYQQASASNAVTVSVTNTSGQNTNSGQFPVGFVASNLPAGIGIATNGLTLNLTGTPTVVGIFTNITVRATNAAGTNSTNLTLRLLPAAPSISRGPITRVQYQVSNGNVVFYNIVNTNGQNYADFPISWSAANLPPGLSLTTNTNVSSYRATIGGTPTNAGLFTNITITATNAGGTISEGLSLTVLPAAPALVLLTNNTFQVNVSNPGGIVVAATNTNSLFTNSFPVSFSLSGAPTGIGMTATNYTTNGVEGVMGGTNPLQPGTFSNVVLTVANAGGTNTTNLTVSVLSAGPLFAVTTNRAQFGSNSPNVLVITVTNSNLITTNSGLSFQVSNLPDGLAITNTNGFVAQVGGTNPAAPTNVTVTVTVTNQGGALSTNVTFAVLPAAPLFSVVTNRAQFGVDSPGALVVTVTNTNGQNTNDFSNFGFRVSPSLAGLGFTNTNGWVGTYGGTNPAVVTNASLTVTVTNAGGSNSTNVSLAVLPALPLFSVTNNRTQFAVNSTNALVVTVTNTEGQNTNAGQFTNFTFSSPSLPGGLAFLATNGLTARAGGLNPSLATNATVTVVVSNAAGATTNTNVNLQILPAAPLVSLAFTNTNSLQYGSNAGSILAVTITNTNGGAQNTNAGQFTNFGYSFSNAPGGLAFTNTNAFFVGEAGSTNLTEAFSNNVTLTVTNEGGAFTTNFILKVLPGVPELSAVTNGILQFGVSNTNAITVTVTNGAGQNPTIYPLTFSASNLPTNFGWTLTKVAGTNGVIGSPNPTLATNVTNLLITVTNAGGSASTNLVLRVLPLRPTNFSYSTNTIRAGQSGFTYVVGIASNGQNTNDFPITFGGSDLPDGLSLATNGVLSGTPTVAATFPSVFTAENAAGLGTNTNAITVLGGAPQIVGTNLISFTGMDALTTNTYFRYQVSARGVGQNWAGRDDFPDDASLTNNWNTNGQVTADAALGATSGILRYTWSVTNQTNATLEWSQPLPVDSPWLASVTVNFISNTTVTNLAGLGLAGDQYLGGMLAAFRDAADPDNFVSSLFAGDATRLSGYASAVNVSNTNPVTNGILTVTSSVNGGWIGLRSTNVSGTPRLLVLGNPGTNSPVWSTNLSLPVSTWTNSARSNSLVLRLSGESEAPVDADFAFEFSEFVIVPLGDLTYSSSNLPAGLTIDPVTGLITGTLPASPLNTTSTVTISNSLGTTNLTLEFEIQ